MINFPLLYNYAEEERRIRNLGEEWKYPAWSCQEIAERKREQLSGWYWIQFRDRSAPVQLFCDFKIGLLGKKNWMRVFHLNMSNPQHQCPHYHFRTVVEDGLRLCGRRRTSTPGCRSMYPTASGYAYRRVCGSLVGYAYYTLDGFVRISCPNCNQVSAAYLDGFSITYGSFRKLLWSFAMSWICTAGTVQGTPPSFVGNNYFCEVPTHPRPANKLYSQDPLFAGRQFCVELPEPTTERLEIRICSDETTENEDAFLQFAELYVQ